MKASVNHLFHKYLLNSCSEEEIKLLLEHFKTEDEAGHLKALIIAELRQQEIPINAIDVAGRLEGIYQKVNVHIQSKKGITKLQNNRKWIYTSIAASITIILSFSLYFYNNSDKQQQPRLVVNNDIAPGKKSATLTLANGKQIVLSAQSSGQLAREAGVSISKTAEGELLYKVVASDNVKPGQMNVLSTSRGETYAISLPDGSKIWLNAASSIRFPASFAALKQRKVMLTGEAYFEIAKDKLHPFIVQTDKQQTEVLGTHFNINSYKEEMTTKTTLLEGSLRVTSLAADKTHGKILKPGEASILTADNGIKVVPADARETMAWKNGFFRFTAQPIDKVMQQISRWYDIEVSYVGKMPEEQFNGAIARNKNISEVLSMLSYAKAVKFKIEGRRVTVMK
ncbi:FecR family protein [Pedobacter africanus]|uniref:FecR family protein n=1 Tax=Pedobacter africanus TaxID=151894 RepID=A0A1W1YWZ2_9SPHI|nr:FecR family protein [Pedobacter africanus]SMC40228.1 FecR family protein [Pedobacter africanus]